MIVNTWTQLLGLAIQVGAGVFAVIKGWQWWLENEYKKAEKKYDEAVVLSNNQLELAKHNSLTAAQVADILKSYKEVIGDLEEMKVEAANSRHTNDEKIKQIISLINKIEHIVEQQTQNFTEFLMGKANNVGRV